MVSYPNTWARGPLTDVANAYLDFLQTINWKNETYMGGIQEGKNKFLSNAWLKACGPKNKYHKTHLASPNAARIMESGEKSPMIWEHVVPKQEHIQSVCENLAISGDLTIDTVIELLEKYWVTATVLKTEDELLSRFKMPNDWDRLDIFVRYKSAGISLIENPFFTS